MKTNRYSLNDHTSNVINILQLNKKIQLGAYIWKCNIKKMSNGQEQNKQQYM